MTSDEFRACLATLHWTLTDLSDVFGGLDEQLTRRWSTGRYEIPDWLADWLADLARYRRRASAAAASTDPHTWTLTKQK